MRRLLFFTVILLFSACDPDRVYEKNVDFDERFWALTEHPQFEFVINDENTPYNLYINVRNEESYPNANLYFTYYLTDSLGNILNQELLTEFLFDKKTGRPFGSSVLGDIYNHRFPILEDYRFESPGKYNIRLEHFMRTDSLQGILGVGLRVERGGS
jgi:gliding motility-associated lipoprotein GldH